MRTQDTLADIAKLGTILSVWAHPDDESYTCAGIMMAAVQNGQEVACITATKGEKGVQDAKRWPPEQLANIRAAEMDAAMAVMGVRHHYWLGYADGGCPQVPMQEAVTKLKAFIEQYKPSTILTFGPDGMTGHDDHRTVSKWVSQAVKGTPITVYHAVELRENYEAMREADKAFNIFFNIDQPPLAEEDECDLLFCLEGDILDKKYEALHAMPSQTEAMFEKFGHDTICRMVCSEAFIKAK
jgi:LmbE family N-acetylglucosaminyl deacetylase